MSEKDYIEETRHWISKIVIGLNLCPFADKVFKADKIRYAICESQEYQKILEALSIELQRLNSTSREEMETAILILPSALLDFEKFNEFVEVADSLLEELELDGVIQIAGFHPKYQFEGTGIEDPENYTNRSPYPMLHLLREESITELGLEESELLEIPKRNIALLKKMGVAKILEKLES